MDINSVIESFAEAFVAANTVTPLTAPEGTAAATAATSPHLLCSGDSTSSQGRPNIPVRVVIERQCNLEASVKSPSLFASATDSTAGGGSSSRLSPSSLSPQSQGSEKVTSITCGDFSGLSSSRFEQDAFAIIPSTILFVDIVKTALCKLGYTTSEAIGAKGFIQIRNWKPLSFDQVTDSTDATVNDILGDVSSAVTLRIRLFRPKGSAAQSEMKDKLLQILLAHSHNLLANSGCPIDQHLLSTLCGRRGTSENEINEDTRKKFDQWYFQQVFNHYRQMATLAAAQQQQQQAQQQHSHPHPQGQQQQVQQQGVQQGAHGVVSSIVTGQSSRRISLNGHVINDDHNEHSGLKESTSSTRINCNGLASSPSNRGDGGGGGGQFVRTRIRTSFDPELELPKLHKWFAENQHPSRTQIHLYVKELNSLESRRGRKPLDVNNVVYWFKNARAAHKRQELKFINGSPLKDGPGGTGGSVNCSSSSSKEHHHHHHHLNNSSLVGQIVEGNGNISLTSGTTGGLTGISGLSGLSNSSSRVSGIRSRQGRDEEDEDEGESGQEDEEEDLATETDDNSSQLSHTLDLSMRAIKKNQGSTANSPDLAGTTMSSNSDSHCGSDHEAIKEEDEEMASEEDEDGDSDRDSYEKYYQTSSVTAVAAAVATAGHMAATFYGSSNNNSATGLLVGNNGGTGNGLPLIPLGMNGAVGPSTPGGGGGGGSSCPSSATSSLATSGLFTLGSTATSTAPESLDAADARRSIRRSRTFIDPMSEVPRLEQWFSLNTHPTHSQIVKYTDELNQLPYRQKFPNLPSDPDEWDQNCLREAVVELLRQMSQSQLSKLCNISQPLLSSIINNKHGGKIGKGKVVQFAKWYLDRARVATQEKSEVTTSTTARTTAVASSASASLGPGGGGKSETGGPSSESLTLETSSDLWPSSFTAQFDPEDLMSEEASFGTSFHPPSTSCSSSSPSTSNVTSFTPNTTVNLSTSTPATGGAVSSSSPSPSATCSSSSTFTSSASSFVPPAGTSSSVRCYFHPVQEVPLLKEWFKSNCKPSDHTLQRYLDILNSGSVRIERPKISKNSLAAWFKNERAKVKRKSTSKKPK